MKRNFALVILLFLVVISINNTVSAQSLATANLATINVDDLSDEQIIGYLRQAEESGYTEQQLEALARQRGMPEAQISKLRRRIEQLKNKRELDTGEEELASSFGRQPVDLERENLFGELSREKEEGELSYRQKRIFGYALFQNENLTFTPDLNIPTPANYQLGPGDEITIDLWGETQLNEVLTVSPEGTVRPENLKPVYVNGYSIERMRSILRDRYSEIFSGLKASTSSNASIFFEASLTGIRTINVSVIGEVNNPGNFALNSLSTVYTALFASGGINENGSFRNIQLVRNNKVVSTIDVYGFLTSGIKNEDILLRSGDIILIRPLANRVEIDGEVRRPGLYEMKPEETIEDLLKFASGFNEKAYQSNVSVERNIEFAKTVLTVSKDDFASTSLSDGDQVVVKEIRDRFENRVIIKGAVYSPGQYQLKEGMTLLSLIELADGIEGDAFTKRINLLRTKDDFTLESMSFDFESLMNGSEEDILLKNDDVITVPSIYDLRNEFYVQISGLVNDEGTYPFIEDMTVQDLVVLSGGFSEGASKSKIEIARRNSENGLNNLAEIIPFEMGEDWSSSGSDLSNFLQPYDHVFIRSIPSYEVQKTVKIEGEVLSPGDYVLSRKDERISDLIRRADGLTPYAFPKGAILIRKAEFAERKSNGELSVQYLNDLKERLKLADDNNLLSNSYELLNNRLAQLELQVSETEAEDEVGSKVKKNLLQENARRDSLVTEIEIKEEEPVAINLDEIIKNPGSKFDLLLKSGDVISIPGKLETVRIAGEVSSPLNVRYDQTYSFKDYILKSGGFLQTAKKSRSYIQYPNGERKGVKRFLWLKKYPKVQPGSTIFVSRKPEREGLNTAEWLAVASSLATISLTINNLSR